MRARWRGQGRGPRRTAAASGVQTHPKRPHCCKLGPELRCVRSQPRPGGPSAAPSASGGRPAGHQIKVAAMAARGRNLGGVPEVTASHHIHGLLPRQPRLALGPLPRLVWGSAAPAAGWVICDLITLPWPRAICTLIAGGQTHFSPLCPGRHNSVGRLAAFWTRPRQKAGSLLDTTPSEGWQPFGHDPVGRLAVFYRGCLKFPAAYRN